MTPGEREPILSVRDLVHAFRERPLGGRSRTVQALRGVSFDLKKGECLAVVGESGCGKTTLARVLLRLIRPTGGSVRFRGREVDAFGKKELSDYRKSVQIVFQDPFGSLNPRIRAGEMLEEVLRLHHPALPAAARKGKVEEVLSLVGLSREAAGRYPHEFSGGQRQRLGIARALSVGPEVLVLDEPVSALDLSVQAQILNLLTGLQAALELTYLFITHDLSVVRQVADRVAVIYMGAVVELGPTPLVLTEPLHPYTKGLLVAARAQEDGPEETGGWGVLEGEPPSPLEPPRGCAFHPRCPHPLKGPECGAVPPPMEGWIDARKVACWRAGEHLADP